jgi:hypothetical protein
MDQVEDALEIPGLLADAQQMIVWTQQVIDKWGSPDEQQKFRTLLGEMRATMEARVLNAEDLTRRIDNLDDLRMKIQVSKDEWWTDYFGVLEENLAHMTNQELAEQLFTLGRRSVFNGDIAGVRSACQQLFQLLPERQQRSVGRLVSSVK